MVDARSRGASGTLGGAGRHTAVRRLDADVVVIGAGLAGLVAARDVARHGHEAIVLEARGRVGGRVLDHPLPGGDVIELGGQYCTPAHYGTVANHAIAELADELGIDVFPTHDEGDKLLRWRGGVIRYRGRHRRALPPGTLVGLVEFALARRRLDRLARRVGSAAPWAAEDARRIDAQTLAAWADRTMLTRTGRELLRLACEPVYAADAGEVSRLHAAVYLAANGSLRAMMGTGGAAQSHRLVGGPQRLAERIAARLDDAVLVGQPVARVSWSPGGVRVQAASVRVHARRAIVATTPPLAARIAFEPSIPEREQLAQRMAHGQVVKVVALYRRPFWREQGLSGQAATDGPIRAIFDDSPAREPLGALAAYAVGRSALALSKLAPRDRHALVVRTLTATFGPSAAAPEEIVEHDWLRDPWAQGGYGCFGAPGAWSTLGRWLRPPVGPLHWAGTETAEAGMGSMSGAVLSGRRAAAEALTALG
jgi:monoamine oxidase